jgi:hypothetical protein
VDEKKVYYLDLQTLLTLLHTKTGTLTTKAKIGNQMVMGSISILRGQIMSCMLESSKGTLYGQEAFERLKPLQEWQVHFEDAVPPLQKSPVLPLAPVNTKQPLEPGKITPMSPAPTGVNSGPLPPNVLVVPQPIHPLNATSLNGYNAQQLTILRLVHSLVDGQRTIAQIQDQMRLPGETVRYALEILRQLGTIAY